MSTIDAPWAELARELIKLARSLNAALAIEIAEREEFAKRRAERRAERRAGDARVTLRFREDE